MKKYILFSAAAFVLLCFNISFSQTNNDKAEAMFKDAMYEFDNGSLDKAIDLLEDCVKLVPDSYVYRYELAFGYYQKKDYEKSIKLCKALMKHKDCNFQVYQLIGNSYDIMGDPDKAIDTYDEGIKRFPDSGRLYFEKAIVYLGQNDIKEAVINWELAVDTEPDYSSSYYYLSKYYSLVPEYVWALTYGEIFCNLEKKSKRTLEISKLLYDTYSKTIEFNEGKTKIDVQILSSPGNMDYLPFLMNYGIVSSLSTADVEKNFNLGTLIKIRKNFLSIWKQKDFLKDYPIVLLDWHQELIDSGYFDAYNYWLFNAGSKDEFNTWYDSNESKFHEFDSWCSKNHIGVNKNHYFSKSFIKKIIKEKSK